VEANLDEEAVVLPLEEGVAHPLLDIVAENAEPGPVETVNGFIRAASRLFLGMLESSVDAVEFFPDGDIVVKLQLFRLDPHAVRNPGRDGSEDDRHKGVENCGEEKEEVQFGEHQLDCDIEVLRILVRKKDGRLDDAKC